MSCLEKDSTLWNIMLRSLLQKDDDILAAMTTVAMARTTLANAQTSMRSPSLTTISVAVPI